MDSKYRQKLINFWFDGSKTALALAKDVLKDGYYDHSLFCGHLALEKILKSKVIGAIDDYAPRTHDLLYLAGLAKIDLDTEQQKLLTEINIFNIEGRYQEERLEIHRKIDKNEAENWLRKIEELYTWLSKQNAKN